MTPRKPVGDERQSGVGTQEWILLSLVLIVPLIIAVVVTLWTLEQAIKRNKKNQTGRKVRRVAEPVADSGLIAAGTADDRDVGHGIDSHGDSAEPSATPASDGGGSSDSGSSG